MRPALDAAGDPPPGRSMSPLRREDHVGVASRVDQLADRQEGFRPEGAHPFESLVPLSEVVGEVLGVGPGSKRVLAFMEMLLSGLGPELAVLREIPLEEIERVGGVPLSEAVGRIRRGALHIAAGYDGEFGTVKIFEPGEREHLLGQMTFVPAGMPIRPKNVPRPPMPRGKPNQANRKKKGTGSGLALISPDDPLAGLASDHGWGEGKVESFVFVKTVQ